MLRIGVVTGSRADYGLLKPLVANIKSDPHLDLVMFVTGSHLDSDHGCSIDRIREDKLGPLVLVPIPLPDNSRASVARSVGNGCSSFAVAFENNPVDWIVVLGDRYEIFAAVQAAFFLRIPILHLHGGELTIGANDDSIRHSITKLSDLHCVAADAYRNRVVQLGEPPNRVFVTGALGLDNLRLIPNLNPQEFRTRFDFDIKRRFILVTMHPETNLEDEGLGALGEMLHALQSLPDLPVLVTGSGADFQGQTFSHRLKDFADNRPNAKFCVSLGQQAFLTALKAASCIVGNSSSGILEAPWCGTVTVNIGERQAGRLRADTVYDSNAERSQIKTCILRALSETNDTKPVSMFGDGYAAPKIVDILNKFGKQQMRPKIFHDILIG